MTNEIVLAGGCFWCIEAAFKEVDGVEEAVSGYTGGHTDNPTYREVCNGETGHAEAVRIIFNSEKISLDGLLELFFRIHDPTTKDRQGPDIGSQYRSMILYQNQEQKDTVMKFIESKKSEYRDELVTEIRQLEQFYRAEEEHQDYFEKNPDDAYCRINAEPKVEKARDFKN